jgi:hypothetical protein
MTLIVAFLAILQTCLKRHEFITFMQDIYNCKYMDESRTRRVEYRRKYNKMDKGAKDKLAGSPGENGGG